MESSGTTPAGMRRRRMKRALAALPLVLLLVQAVWVRHSLVEGGRLRPIPVADTDSYVKLSRYSTVDGAISHYRTYGYPLLLKTFGRDALIAVELWLYLAGAISFFGAVWVYTGNGWIGLAAASPLFYADALKLLGRIQPDFVACAFVLFCVAAVLALVVRRRNWVLWMGLTVAFFASYQIRPATLFMAAWLPVLGWALAALYDGTWRRPRMVWLAGLALAMLGPYLLFIGWRGSRIGEFGLVAFGGYNMSGLAASLVDEPMLEELEELDAQLAEVILKRRGWRGWEPYRLGEGSSEWFGQYSPNIWKVSVQAAKGQLRREGRSVNPPTGSPASLHVAVNSRLRDFSRQVIRRRPRKYLEWVRDANLYGWRQLPRSPWIAWPGSLLVLALAGWWFALRRRAPAATRKSSIRLRTTLGVLLLGASFFCAYVLLVSLLSFPFTRYFQGAALLLPGGLCAALVGLALEAAQRFIPAAPTGAVSRS